MSVHPLPIPTPRASTEQMPAEWLDELHGLHPESHEYGVVMQALSDLAMESGVEFHDIPTQTTPAEHAPKGFTELRLLDAGDSAIDTDYLQQKVHSLRDGVESIISPSMVEVTSDTGKKIRVCDLRGLMTDSVRKLAPETATEKERLDSGFWMDMKHLADQGRMRNTVTGASGIGYTKVPKSKIRGYYTPVRDNNNPEHVLTIARLADCRDSISAEAALYRAVFAKKL